MLRRFGWLRGGREWLPGLRARAGPFGALTPDTSHPYFVLFSGRPVRAIVAGLPKPILGRHYAEDELQLLDAD